ncbi:hypothetical protein ACT7T5_003385 [Vibrio cholerae]
MNTNKLKAYAPKARLAFMDAVKKRAAVLGIYENKISEATTQGTDTLIEGRIFTRKQGQQRQQLVNRIEALGGGKDGYNQFINEMAFTWFNRFTAIRFMEVNGYLDHGFRMLSKEEGAEFGQGFEILAHAADVAEDLGLNKSDIVEMLLAGDKEEELYRELLLAQCHQLSKIMPFMFEKLDDATELLLPDNLTKTDSILKALVNDVPEDNWREIEVIGWLYQFYISEHKDAVIGKVVKKEDIPAATQLFTPNWIVKYLVQNSLGRQWLATYPDSELKDKMEYYITPAEQSDEVIEQLKAITPTSIDPEQIKVLDPACGSGHILVEVYEILREIYLDSYTEQLNERTNIARFDSESSYSNGQILRGESTVNMRDSKKMGAAVNKHFGDNSTAADGYGGSKEIIASTTQAKSTGNNNQATEADHAVPCSVICNSLKKNKGLTDKDIKDIVNIDENLVATSKNNNRGAVVGKFGKSQSELQQEIEQGFVIDAKGKKHQLSEDELTVRKNMVSKMRAAQKAIDSKTNEKVMDNLKNNRDVQKRLASDASDAAANQSLGDLIIFMFKPLYFELKDCFVNGIEGGVSANSFKSALTIRVNRIKHYVMDQASETLKGGAISFFKNFVSMLLEGIVNCFVGVFKSIFRMLKEGFKVLMQIIPILRDKKKSIAEKGDAILKLAAASLSIFASIGIESWLNSMGIGEPWSIIISSVLTAVLIALVMYLLDKVDLFGLKEEARLNRIDEILSLRVEEAKDDMFSMVRALS